MWSNFLEGGPASRQEGTDWRKKVAAEGVVQKRWLQQRSLGREIREKMWLQEAGVACSRRHRKGKKKEESFSSKGRKEGGEFELEGRRGGKEYWLNCRRRSFLVVMESFLGCERGAFLS